MALRAQDVFTPGSFPTYTYVERADENLEQQLRDAIETPGQVISISGPSKSGKSVLVERVVTKENLIEVTGAGVRSGEELWSRALDAIGEPTQTTATKTTGVKGAVTLGTKGEAGIPFVVKGEVSAGLSGEASGTSTTGVVAGRRGLQQIIGEIADSSYVLLVDDFHYIDRAVQAAVAKTIKDAAHQAVKIVTASVTHRSDDVIRSLPDLRGRVTNIDLKYWDRMSLIKIANLGFEKLKLVVDPSSIDEFATEASGSPQLMQAICLHTCLELGFRVEQEAIKTVTISRDQRRRVFERTVSSANYRTLVDILIAGVKTRGTPRAIFDFKDGSRGDVYRCILCAIAADPPRQSFDYAEILRRVADLCTDLKPVGSAITGSCVHMTKLAIAKQPEIRVVDWDDEKQVLDLADPYLLFYLRWSGHLSEPGD